MSEEVRLSEEGTKQFEDAIEAFKTKMRKACDEVLSSVYVGLEQHIETDAWMNYRTAMRQELAYANESMKDDGGLWARNMRDRIFKEHKNELVELLNRDSLDKIAELEDKINQIYKMRSY